MWGNLILIGEWPPCFWCCTVLLSCPCHWQIWSWIEDMTSSTGWMSTRGLSTSLVWWCTGVCMTGHLGTSLITSSQPLMLLLDVFVYDLLTAIVSLFLAANLARTAVGLFITLVWQSGTCCQMNLQILTVLMALDDSWKQFVSTATSVTSALEVFQRDALSRCISFLLA